MKLGRPISFKTKELDKSTLNNYQKEIMALKEQLKLKDEIILGKDKHILLLESLRSQ
jgi:hypothetical protein